MATTIAPEAAAGPDRFAGRPLRRGLSAALLALPLLCGTAAAGPDDGDVAADLAAVAAVGSKGEGNAEAVASLARLSAADADRLPDLLAAFADAGPVGRNLLSGAVQAVADGADDGELGAVLARVLSEPGLHPQAAGLAFGLLREVNPPAAATYLERSGLTSAAPPVRREAVAAKLAALGDDAPAEDLAALLDRTLDRDQVEDLAGRLAKLGDPVDLPRQFGFLTDWQVVGPFDHRGDTAWDRTLPPEETPGRFDPDATFPTEHPEGGDVVTWQPLIAGGKFGLLNVAEDLSNWKGSAVVLAREYEAPAAGPVTFRVGTPNAFKLYLNGDLVFARPEYHRGTKMDQYVIPATVTAGRNVLMIKLLQNEQEQSWAQKYQMQFRVTDAAGAAVREPGSYPAAPTEGSE